MKNKIKIIAVSVLFVLGLVGMIACGTDSNKTLHNIDFIEGKLINYNDTEYAAAFLNYTNASEATAMPCDFIDVKAFQNGIELTINVYTGQRVEDAIQCDTSVQSGTTAKVIWLYEIRDYSTVTLEVSDGNSYTFELTQPESTEIPVEITEEPEADPVVAFIEEIVVAFNAQANEQLVFAEDFTPSDKESGHYRTEFRLNAYKDALGKSYLLGDKVVDFVASKDFFGDISFRVYTNDTSWEQVISLVQLISPLVDKELSSEELKATINKITESKSANGLYFGKLGMVLSGSDDKGYELMLKND